VKGPFNKTIPQSLEKKAEMKTLNYTGPRELLAEKLIRFGDGRAVVGPVTVDRTQGDE
jgi:hypothetical protein